jgi:8-oxo-dGTP diphosphatase
MVLGPPLPPVHSTGPDGEPLEISFWAARTATSGQRPTPTENMSWVDAAVAADLLATPEDLGLLEALLDRAEDGALDTRPVLLLRHARARPRDSWSHADYDRPLVGAGRRQALALTALLRCWRPQYLVCSPWLRCTETLRPYTTATGCRLRTKGSLSEDGHARDPGKTHKQLQKVLDRDDAVVLCTHHTVLADLIPRLAALTVPAVRTDLPGTDPFLLPAQVLVTHLARGPQPGDDDAARIVEVELHLPG